jgi:hypothetical protein
MEFTGLLNLKIEATIKAENKGEDLSFFSD